MLFIVIAKRSHFGVDGAGLKLFPPCCHSCLSEVSSDVSYGGSVKQQTPWGIIVQVKGLRSVVCDSTGAGSLTARC